MNATKLNLGMSLFVCVFSLFLLDAGAREWQIIIFFAPLSACLGAWLAFQKLLQREVALGVFGLIQGLYWPFAFVVLKTFAEGVPRQVILSALIVAYLVACSSCLWQAYQQVVRRANGATSTSA